MTITYRDETADSIAAHDHAHPFTGHTEAWYANFGGKCPTCDTVPEFETVKVKRQATGGGIKAYGLSSGERINR